MSTSIVRARRTACAVLVSCA
ncbi:MAG: hypothetical protein QOE04_1888, partial [Mycobacterium sp.]|nr:hypothetical protein [Mycobacterium sp.]